MTRIENKIPTTYLKSANVAGNTLYIIRSDGTEVQFEGGGSSDPSPYVQCEYNNGQLIFTYNNGDGTSYIAISNKIYINGTNYSWSGMPKTTIDVDTTVRGWNVKVVSTILPTSGTIYSAYIVNPAFVDDFVTTDQIPDTSKFVTTDTAQTISGHKIFDEGSIDVAASGNTGKALRLYNGGIGLYDKGTNGTRAAYLTLPRTTGTLALTSDIYYQNNDKFVNTGFYNINGYLTGSGKEIGFTIILPKNLKNIKTISVNKLSCVIRGTGGYLNGSSYIDYTKQTGITVNAHKSADNAVFIQIKMSNTTWGGTNNTPVSIAFNNGGLDITLNS